MNLYRSNPLEIIDDIPIFSAQDPYVINYEKIAEDHLISTRNNNENPYIENNLWEKLEDSTRQLIKKFVPLGGKILDVGVGLGRVLEPLNDYDRYGIDISLDYLKEAKKKGINVCKAKIEDMPYVEGIFDAIVTCDVLEHVLDLHECTKKLLDCLKPGGILIVRVPNKEDLAEYLREDLPYEFIHLRSFDESSLRLHFCKIFKLKFIDAASVEPYLQGHSRLKIKLFSENVRSEIAKMSTILHPAISAINKILCRIGIQILPLTKRPSLSRLKSLQITSGHIHHYSFLSWLSNFNADELLYWLYEMKKNNPDDYDKIKGFFVEDIEVNLVFKKP